MPTPPTRRRGFQFGLRELFWLTLVVALLLVAIREHLERQRLEAVMQRYAQTQVMHLKMIEQIQQQRFADQVGRNLLGP